MIRIPGWIDGRDVAGRLEVVAGILFGVGLVVECVLGIAVELQLSGRPDRLELSPCRNLDRGVLSLCSGFAGRPIGDGAIPVVHEIGDCSIVSHVPVIERLID